MTNTERALAWISAAAFGTLAIAWIAVQLQQEGIAPAGLFPLAVGAALGGGIALVSRKLAWPTRTIAIAATAGLGLLVVVLQDYIGHRASQARYEAEFARQSPLAAAPDEFRPTFVRHLRAQVSSRPGWWILDLLFTSASAGATTAWLVGRRRNFDPAEIRP